MGTIDERPSEITEPNVPREIQSNSMSEGSLKIPLALKNNESVLSSILSLAE